jgi:DNA modification methylase
VSIRIVTGDCRTRLAEMRAQSVQCCVTSPPYFGLRDYGCDGQIGLEATPDAFVAEMVAVFREVRRVLRDDATVWLNLGDSYASGNRATYRSGASDNKGQLVQNDMPRPRDPEGIKPKDLLGIPWMVAFALRADGWFLRQDIIWSKPNPMPESVTDRCTKAHEYLFLLSKSARYHYDADAIAEAAADTSLARWAQDGLDKQLGSDRVPGKTNGAMKAVGGTARPQAKRAVELAREKGLTEAHIEAIRAVGIADAGKALTTTNGAGHNTDEVKRLAAEAKIALGGYYREFLIAVKRNRRSVWTVATQPFSEAHFATFPPALIEPCILAGCPKGGMVLDPFGGAGTTGLVADRLGRDCTLIELNPAYAAMAENRLRDDAGMFAAVATGGPDGR